MSIWKRYIAWIDNSMGDGWPNMNNLPSLVPIVPLTLVFGPLVYLDPPEITRHWIVVIAAIPTACLFLIWAWRACLACRRQMRIIRGQKR